MPLSQCGHRALRIARLRGAVRYSSSSAKPSGLQGSVSAHARQLVLFTGRKYDTLPSHLQSVSPLYAEVVKRAEEQSSPLSGFAVAVTDSRHASHTKQAGKPWSSETSRFETASASHELEEYGGVVYPDRKEVPFPISLDNLRNGKLDEFCASLPAKKLLDDTTDTALAGPSGKNEEIDIFVCTHGARDCRCGDVGSAFYDALAREARRRKVGHAAKAFKEGSGPVRIHRTTHIGGHRYAATCFTSTGDWYGLLSATDATTFIDYIERQRRGESAVTAVWWEKWRGRAGLSARAQEQVYESALAAMAASSSTSTTDLASLMRKKRKERTKPLGDAVTIPFQRFDGSVESTRAFVGETLMDVAKRYDLVEATCGGACECATCHIHLRQGSEAGSPPVPESSDEEDDQLEYAISPDNDSRLACQIIVEPAFVEWLDKGGIVQLPRY